MPPNNLERPTNESAPNRLQRLALSGILGMSSAACQDTRADTYRTIQADNSYAGLGEVVNEVYPAKPEEKQKVLIANENASEGVQTMAELAPGRSWVGKLEGNGGRDVMIYVPENFDYEKPYELIYFFHGTGAMVIDKPEVDLSGENFGQYLPGKNSGAWYKNKELREPCVGVRAMNQVLGAAERAQDEGRNQVVVYPLSEVSRGTAQLPDGSYKRQDLKWMRPTDTDDSMFVLNKEARGILEWELDVKADVQQITLKGHSAGGAPLGNILGSGFPADRVDFLDATYWSIGYKGTPNAYRKAMEANPNMEINVFIVKRGKKTDRHSRRIDGKEGVERVFTKTVKRQDEEGHGVVHGKLMRNFWTWEREVDLEDQER